MGDSQWLGQGATQGHYVDLTDFMKSNGIDKTVTPGTLAYYGEYPNGSGKYYAYPTEGDANGWSSGNTGSHRMRSSDMARERA